MKRTKTKVSKNTLISLIIGTLASAILYSLAIKCFIQAEGVNMLANGFGGISIMISRIFRDAFPNNSFFSNDSLVFSILFVTMNIPLLLVSYKRIGKLYTIFTALNILLVSILDPLIPSSLFSFLHLDPVSDMLLIAICAGILVGLSSGVALKLGLSTGGVDTLVTFISLKTNKEIGWLVIYFNAFILLAGGFIFNQWVAMLYTIIFIFVTGQVINAVYRRTKKSQINIVTNLKDEVTKEIIAMSKHGITTVVCEGGFSKVQRYQLQTIVLEEEVKNIVKKVKETDPEAFISVLSVHDTIGAFTMPKID